MKFVSEITIVGIVKEYVEKFRGRTERENKDTLFAVLCWIEEPYLEMIKEIEKENAVLRERITDLHKPPLYDGYSLQKENAELKKQIENMQITEYSNLHEQKKELHKNLIDGFTEQLGIMDKEDELFSLKEIKSIINSILEE